MEIKEIYIKNFRNIGEEGAEIKLSPITIFTGCNSAGKSTAAKALLLLESYLSDVKANNYNLIDTPLDFSKVVKLGTFDTVLNSSAKADGYNCFVLGYSFESSIIVADISVRFTFGEKISDSLNNGYLKKLSILIDSNEFLSISIQDDSYFCEIKDKEKFIEYIRCYKIRHIASSWKSYYYDFKEKEELSKKFQWRNPEQDDTWEKVTPYITELISIETQLIHSNIIRKTLNTADRDSIFTKAPSFIDVISANEDIVEFEPFWAQVHKYEENKQRRLTLEDFAQIKTKIREHIKEKEYAKLGENVCRWDELDRYLDKSSNIIIDKIYSYVISDAKDVMEYNRSQNTSALEECINNTINDIEFQSWAIQVSINLNENMGFLAIFEKVKEYTWIGRCLYYIFRRSLNPNIIKRTGYVDASTIDVKRLYPLDLSNRFGNLWRRFNDVIINRRFSVTSEKGDFLKKWLREFNICEDIIIDNMEGTLRIKLISKDIPEGRLLADYGYGVTQLVSLLLNIEIAISQTEDDFDEPVEAGDESYAPGIIPYLLILEEPEVHLHPSLQSRLADMFLDATRHGVHFIVETHSEYLVRRTQVIVASIFSKNTKYIPKFRVYYFPEDGLPYDMRYKTNGHFKEVFGEGFFDEAGKWSRELMRSKNK
ncbi:MAG: AAA family ATPase [Muribaculaceae bacterium]|nr:AAA family ATPase [Muribaculaceae bacterium]